MALGCSIRAPKISLYEAILARFRTSPIAPANPGSKLPAEQIQSGRLRLNPPIRLSDLGLIRITSFAGITTVVNDQIDLGFRQSFLGTSASPGAATGPALQRRSVACRTEDKVVVVAQAPRMQRDACAGTSC